MLEIIDITFDRYKMEYEHLKSQNDTIEKRIQNDIVKPFLSSLFPEFDVIDTSTKLPVSKKHDYRKYCGTYNDKAGKVKAWTPDLVIAKNWNRHNIDNVVEYLAVIEVKSPDHRERIYNKKYEEYGKLTDELKGHLSATENNKLILTDVLKWEFYRKKDDGDELVPIQTFELYNSFKGINWGWKKRETRIVENDISHLDNQEILTEFEELKKFIKKFITS